MGINDRAPEALPVRTSRYRPTGRHRSQHQLSVPPEAPALVLAVLPGQDGLPAAVVVPLLICPDAGFDAALGAAVEADGFPVIVAKPLGAHPVLAGALHARLSEAGLARVDQIGQMSIASAAEGVLVAALGDAEAMS